MRVMIAGIGGASLGTEIAKCLALAGRYEVYGCDVSPTAFGLYSPQFVETFRVDRADYVDRVIDVCARSECRWLIPGGEQPTSLLSAAAERVAAAGIRLVTNSPEVVSVFSDKQATFEKLAALGVEIPKTRQPERDELIAEVGFPCVVKPATGSGGSSFVFLATTLAEASIYTRFLRDNGHTPLVQEYIGVEEGEFTVGVLSLPDGMIAGSIALRRALDAKLSIAYRGRGGLISSGYSQGYIGDFPEVRRTAEAIAAATDSRGPINVQGRVRDGRFIPFEINPRFSASTYLRALAGFNEIDMYLQFLCSGKRPTPAPVKPGWYLRSLAEQFVPAESLK